MILRRLDVQPLGDHAQRSACADMVRRESRRGLQPRSQRLAHEAAGRGLREAARALDGLARLRVVLDAEAGRQVLAEHAASALAVQARDAQGSEIMLPRPTARAR